MGALTRAHNLLSRHSVYSIYYSSTLILPVESGEGRGLRGLVGCCLRGEDDGREQETLLLSTLKGDVYILLYNVMVTM